MEKKFQRLAIWQNTGSRKHFARMIQNSRLSSLATYAIRTGDLYHAHILLPPSAPDRFGSTGQLFSGSPLMLYHSDEMLHRWRLDDGELPIERRRPRSIIGYPDGRIQPAAQLMRNPIADAVHYEWHGTIHSDELARELPELIAPRSDRTVRIGNADCVVNLIVDISPHNTGRPTITVSGRPLALTMDCKRYR